MRFTLRQLEVFATLAELEHFGRTAEALGLSQPTVSSDVTALEQAIGVRLFHRSPSGTRLSPGGAALVPHARAVLAASDTFASAARLAADGPVEVRLAASPSLINDLVPRVLQEVAASWPRIRVTPVEVATGEVFDAVSSRAADIGLGHHVRTGRGLRRGVVGRDELHLLGAPAVVGRVTGASLAPLSDRSLMLWPRAQNPAYHDAILAACRERGWTGEVLETPARLSGPESFRLTSGATFALVPVDYARAAPPTLTSRPLRPRVTVPLHALVVDPPSREMNLLLHVLLDLHG